MNGRMLSYFQSNRFIFEGLNMLHSVKFRRVDSIEGVVAAVQTRAGPPFLAVYPENLLRWATWTYESKVF